jgi:hypothetical protein
MATASERDRGQLPHGRTPDRTNSISDFNVPFPDRMSDISV